MSELVRRITKDDAMETPATITQVSLLLRIRDLSDAGSWREFAELYVPLIERFGRMNGLQPADVNDLVQDVLCIVAKKIPEFEYDPQIGRFRSWLFSVSRRRIYKLLERRNGAGSGDSRVQLMLLQQPARDEDLARWNAEYDGQRFQWAARRVEKQFRPATWQAFWRTAVEAQSIPAVAEALDMSVGAVHIARSRVIAAFQRTLETVGD
jgi:RNA polymerase sigma factor (sigma-70 family)